MRKWCLLGVLCSSLAFANTAPTTPQPPTDNAQPTTTSASAPTTSPQTADQQPTVKADETPQSNDATDTAVADMPKNPHDQNAPTLAQITAPSDSELSKANAELLAKNASLERQVNELTTQVNVLTHERSGQLYLYGALTVLGTLILSILLGIVIARRSQSNRW